MNDLLAEQQFMKFKCLAALIACTVMQSAIFSPVYAQDASKINKWFEDIDKKYPNLRKKQNVGNIQDPGKIGTPGKFQNPGNINAPQGLQAIKTKSDPCSQRFSIGADTLFEFDKATLTPRAAMPTTSLNFIFYFENDGSNYSSYYYSIRHGIKCRRIYPLCSQREY